jgi:hypothetical protein
VVGLTGSLAAPSRWWRSELTRRLMLHALASTVIELYPRITSSVLDQVVEGVLTAKSSLREDCFVSPGRAASGVRGVVVVIVPARGRERCSERRGITLQKLVIGGQ